MTKEIEHNLSGTAFLVNYSRSRLVDISRDLYAHLWVTPGTVTLWNDFAKNVYPNDDLNLSLRNRFFLEMIQKFIADNNDSVFVNIAAGFTNYPFLIDQDCKYVELDLPNIIALKKANVAKFVRENKLPNRAVEYISVDLTDIGQREKMKESLIKIIYKSPSFVLMEGLTYYLNKEILDDLFSALRNVQKKNSIIAFDYWKPDALKYPTMGRLKSYLDKMFGCQGGDWNLFDEKYVKKIKGYIEICSTNISQLELKYSETRKLQGRENMIPGNFAILKRETGGSDEATS